MKSIDENGNLTDGKERLPVIQVDRSSKDAWLNSLGEMYMQHLQNPDDSGVLNAYQGELQSYNASFPSPPPIPTDIESVDRQAAITMQSQEASEYARNHPEDQNAQYFARAKLEQKMVSVPGELNVPGNHVCRANPNDNSEPYIEVVGEGPAAPVEIIS